VQLAEWVSWRAPSRGKRTVRALLLNNDESCATGVALRSGSFTYPVRGPIAPWGLRVVELQVPAGLKPGRVEVVGSSDDCPPRLDWQPITGRWRAICRLYDRTPQVKSR